MAKLIASLDAVIDPITVQSYRDQPTTSLGVVDLNSPLLRGCTFWMGFPGNKGPMNMINNHFYGGLGYYYGFSSIVKTNSVRNRELLCPGTTKWNFFPDEFGGRPATLKTMMFLLTFTSVPTSFYVKTGDVNFEVEEEGWGINYYGSGGYVEVFAVDTSQRVMKVQSTTPSFTANTKVWLSATYDGSNEESSLHLYIDSVEHTGTTSKTTGFDYSSVVDPVYTYPSSLGYVNISSCNLTTVLGYTRVLSIDEIAEIQENLWSAWKPL